MLPEAGKRDMMVAPFAVMEETDMPLETLLSWLQQHPYITDVLRLIGIVVLSLIVYFVAKQYAIRLVSMVVRRTPTEYDDLVIEKMKPVRFAYFAALLVLYFMAQFLPQIGNSVQKIVSAVMIVLAVAILGSFLDALVILYHKTTVYDGTPIKGYVQVVKIFLYLVAVILLVSMFSGQSPWVLLSGLGAMTAVLILIFQDTILSLVASLQITTNNLVRVGDWLEVPTFGADGDVIDVALHAIQIQNWNKSISVIPTHKLLQASFRNWRGMEEFGGRRIKRSINIDMTSIRMCDEEMISRFERIGLIRDYVRQKKKDIEQYNVARGFDPERPAEGRQMTNVGTFRAYVVAYLRDNPNISQDMTLMVRQLEPGPEGLPIEVYAFSSDINWVNYEGIQSDIFDHLLAVLPEFDLRVFQSPGGKQLEDLAHLLGPDETPADDSSPAEVA
jgi:miniconductance mechanosensitive channel